MRDAASVRLVAYSPLVVRFTPAQVPRVVNSGQGRRWSGAFSAVANYNCPTAATAKDTP
jgi:hypothetical protein